MDTRIASFDLSTTEDKRRKGVAWSAVVEKDTERHDVRRLKHLRNCCDCTAAAAALCSMVLAVAEVYTTQNYYSQYEVLGKIRLDTSEDSMRGALLALSGVLGDCYSALCVLGRHYCLAALRRLHCASVSDGVAVMLLELLLSVVSPPVGVDSAVSLAMGRGTYSYTVGDICTLVCLLRVVFLYRVLPRLVVWSCPSAKQVCARHGVKPSFLFVVKCELKHRPALLISLTLLTAVVVFGCAIRVLERSFVGVKCSNDLAQLTNAMWLSIITMTTVGYGDGYPSTHGGRLVCALAAVFGMVLTSLFVVSLANFATFSPAQMKAYYAIKQGDQNAAANIVKQAFTLKAALTPFRLSAVVSASLSLRRSLRAQQAPVHAVEKGETLRRLEAQVCQKIT